MTLPLEILLHIFDMLVQDDDSESLKNFALVNSQLPALCQSHLFACVTLFFEGQSKREDRLWKVLQANPKLGTYVKKLHISFVRPSSATYTNPLIPSILAYCTGVTSFKVESLQSEGFASRWARSFPWTTLASLESIIYSPALTRLEIDGITLPPMVNFLSPCSSALTELRFLPNSPEMDTMDHLKVKGVKGSPISLRKLYVLSAIPLSSFLEAEREDGYLLFDFSRLEEFSAYCNEASNAQGINTLLFERAAPLTTLELQLCSYCCSLPPREWGEDLFAWRGFHQSPIGIPCFSTLRVIIATVWILSAHHTDPFRSITTALHRFPGQNVVENIVFNIRSWIHPGEAIPAQDGWLSLVTSFTTGFPCLKKVDVNVLASDFKDIDDDGSTVLDSLERLPFKDLDLPFIFNFSVAP